MNEELIVRLPASPTVAGARNATQAALEERVEALRIEREAAIAGLIEADRKLEAAKDCLVNFNMSGGALAQWPSPMPVAPAPTTDAPRRR